MEEIDNHQTKKISYKACKYLSSVTGRRVAAKCLTFEKEDVPSLRTQIYPAIYENITTQTAFSSHNLQITTVQQHTLF